MTKKQMADDIKHRESALKEWAALYDAAFEFRKIEPWEWMSDTDIFGVQDPLTKEIGYCCIMGALGEVLGMAVYMGTEGLSGYKKIASGKIRPGSPDMLYVQNCLLASFENKNYLQKEDLDITRLLGLRPSGHHAWPLFRSYKPGYLPWFLEGKEAAFLIHVLRQAKDVSLRLREDGRIIHAVKKHHYLVRVPDQTETGILWRDEEIRPADLKAMEHTLPPMDEVRMQRIIKVARRLPESWEIDFFHAPTPVEDMERPYFPYAMMIAGHESGFIHDIFLSNPAGYQEEFIDKLLSDFETMAFFPAEIQIRKEEAVKLFGPYAAKLGIPVRKVKLLPNIDRARREMEKQFGRMTR